MALVSQREKEATVALGAHQFICVFHLHKQSSSDIHVAHEVEHAAIFSSPRLNSRPCSHIHMQPRVVIGKHESRSD